MTRSLVIGALIAGLSAGQELKVVKNAPFTATATTESTQTLADGNVVTHTTTAAIARDTAGRTRREQYPVVFIHDPVAGVVWILDSRTRTARHVAIASTDVPSATQTTNGSVSLGSEVIAGVNSEGTRLTRILAPGEAGNERPIQVTTEAWFSSDLQTAIMTKTTDPRVGETVYRLTDIQRGEPLYSLFEVPPEYAIRDEPPSPESRPIESPRNK